MVTDAALWFILVAMFGWIVCGCYATRREAVPQRFEDRPRGLTDSAGPHAGFD